jgi:hypothetical protein
LKHDRAGCFHDRLQPPLHRRRARIRGRGEKPARRHQGDGRFYPGLGEHLEEETTVAIDGALYETAYYQPIRDGCEIFFIPKLEGGWREFPAW